MKKGGDFTKINDYCYRLRGGQGLVTNRHTHDAIELIHIVDAEGMLLKDNRSYAIEKNSLLVIDARKPHVINLNSPDEYVRSKIIIEAGSFFDFCKTAGLTDERVASILETSPISTAGIPEADRLFRDFTGACESEDKNAVAFAHSYVLELLRIADSASDSQCPESANKIVQAILDCIHRTDGLTSLAEISEQLHFSRYYLCHLFKEKVGITLSSYLNEKRYEKCAALLLGSDLSISEIASVCGFDYISSFTRFFKSRSGISPLAYRQALSNRSKYN